MTRLNHERLNRQASTVRKATPAMVSYARALAAKTGVQVRVPHEYDLCSRLIATMKAGMVPQDFLTQHSQKRVGGTDTRPNAGEASL